MKLLTTSIDEKITAENHLLEMSIGEYSLIAVNILHNNGLQRRRVKTANRSYSLLKDDIKVGCVIPPLVLAIFPAGKEDIEKVNKGNVVDKMSSEDNNLLILDGLQRTYTILDLISEIENTKPTPDAALIDKVKSLPLRIEVYTGISKVGVLYRMLTLNTGQNPMTTRHQVEMIYSDYKSGFDDLTFITEADNKVPSGDDEFRFSDILDGFLSYVTGDYLPIDREDLVAIIKNLEALTKEDKQQDLFKLLINTYNSFRKKVNEISDNWVFDEDSSLNKKAFARNVNELFSKVQVLSGFGAALSFLIERKLIADLEEVRSEINDLKNNNVQESLNKIIEHLDFIQVHAKKIGNEQRMYFYFLIRSIFNKNNDGHLDLEKSVEQAYTFYLSNTLR